MVVSSMIMKNPRQTTSTVAQGFARSLASIVSGLLWSAQLPREPVRAETVEGDAEVEHLEPAARTVGRGLRPVVPQPGGRVLVPLHRRPQPPLPVLRVPVVGEEDPEQHLVAHLHR